MTEHWVTQHPDTPRTAVPENEWKEHPRMQLTVFEPIALADDLPCRTTDPELFFAESPADVETAKAVCTACAIREVCLSGALERKEPWGVWGGELFVQGAVVAHKRPRGRPRKTELAQTTGAAVSVLDDASAVAA